MGCATKIRIYQVDLWLSDSLECSEMLFCTMLDARCSLEGTFFYSESRLLCSSRLSLWAAYQRYLHTIAPKGIRALRPEVLLCNNFDVYFNRSID